jgi:hypothetical protein
VTTGPHDPRRGPPADPLVATFARQRAEIRELDARLANATSECDRLRDEVFVLRHQLVAAEAARVRLLAAVRRVRAARASGPGGPPPPTRDAPPQPQSARGTDSATATRAAGWSATSPWEGGEEVPPTVAGEAASTPDPVRSETSVRDPGPPSERGKRGSVV